jgi:enamine deaminase RidA (YjgF/YER057c/UK114 family)
MPLIMTHSWSGSILELVKVIGQLTDPTPHGGRAEDAFDLVLPSMPGCGFSGQPQSPRRLPTPCTQHRFIFNWRKTMNKAISNTQKTVIVTGGSQGIGAGASAEQRLQQLGIRLPAPPKPFGTYVEAVQTGNLLFLSGMLPTEGHEAKFIGRVGAELDVEAGRKAAHLAALNVLAVTREHLGSLDKVARIVRLGVSVATFGDVRDQPKVADAASELLQDVFGKDKSPCRLVFGVASLPLGTPVELEVIFELVG